VIFLDEPTTGLDPRSRRTMWEIIRELVAKG
jgi:ABC-2 type transport system ATP-binding protein